MRYFDRLHPLCSFLYFATVILLAMFTMHPVLVSVCYLTGMIFYGILCGFRRWMKSLGFTVPLMLGIALLNPLFVHKGSTVLFFINNNPVTLQALIYGGFSALMIAAVYYWFSAYSEIMTSDKFIYLFGRVIPKLSLVLSMTLSAVPRFKRKYREIDEAQRAMGIYETDRLTQRWKSRFAVLSTLTSWALEGSIDTADSMRARGYGLHARTAYSPFRMTLSDAFILGLVLLFAGTSIVLIAVGAADFSYYPVMEHVSFHPSACVLYIALTLLTGLSIFCEIKESVLWHYLKSTI